MDARERFYQLWLTVWTTRACDEVRRRLAADGHYLTDTGEAVLRDTAEFFTTYGAHVAERRRMMWRSEDVDRLHLCMLDNIRY